MSGDTPIPSDVALAGRVGGYTVEGLLGRGGMASVYLARDVHLGVLRALKVLEIPHASLRQRLLEEGRAQASLDHPNIVHVYGVVELGGGLGLVMEFVDGPSLEELLRGVGNVSLPQADDIMASICDGIGYAHAAGLIHRDLKPGNVLLQRRDGRFVPKIADFGLVKAIDSDRDASATRSGVSLGTPSYMAPEQTRDAKLADTRADVWALGVIGYRLATGRLPFQADDMIDLQLAVRDGVYVDPVELNPGIPHRLATAIRGALVVDRDARTPSVAHFAADWFDGAALGALPRPPAPWPRALVDRASKAIESVEAPAPPEASQPTLGSVMVPAPAAASRGTGPTLHADPEPPPARATTGWRGPLAVLVLGVVVAFGLRLWLGTGSAPEPVTPPDAIVLTPPPVEEMPTAALPDAPTPPVPADADPQAAEPPDEADAAPATEVAAPPRTPPSTKPGAGDKAPARPASKAPATPRAPTPPTGSAEAPAAAEEVPTPEVPAPSAPQVAAPAPPPATDARVHVHPSTLQAYLVTPQGSDSYSAQRPVPPGEYNVQVMFTDRPTPVATLVLRAGDVVNLKCEPPLKTCKVSR